LTVQAYEILIGKRRGKEIDDTSRGGWDFHDWYWKFSMRRRKKGGAATEDAPPVASMRGQWQQQVAGLKAKAAAKRQQHAQRADSQWRVTPREPSVDPSSVWRSATKRPQAAKEEQADAQAETGASAFAAAADGPPQHAAHRQSHNVQSAAESSGRASATEGEPAAWQGPPPSVEGPHRGTPNPAARLHSILQTAVHAMHAMRDRHEHAVQAHGHRVQSHIASLGQNLTLRLRLGLHGLGPSPGHEDGETGSEGHGHGMHGAESYGFHAFSDGLPHARSSEDGSYFYNSAEGAWANGGGHANAHRAAHARKFADREAVQTRMGSQLAGLKRRSALKREFAE